MQAQMENINKNVYAHVQEPHGWFPLVLMATREAMCAPSGQRSTSMLRYVTGFAMKEKDRCQQETQFEAAFVYLLVFEIKAYLPFSKASFITRM